MAKLFDTFEAKQSSVHEFMQSGHAEFRGDRDQSGTTT